MLNDKLHQYCCDHTQPESKTLKYIVEHTQQHVTGAGMISGPLVMGLIKSFIASTGAQSIIDIGTYTGYSAVAMAEALTHSDARVCSYEVSERSYVVAYDLIKASPVSDKIQLFLGDALIAMRSKANHSVDLIYLDADKQNAPQYYDVCIDKLKPGGVLVVDDVLWEGEVLDPNCKRASSMHQLNQKITQDARVDNVLLPIRHGLQWVTKRFTALD